MLLLLVLYAAGGALSSLALAFVDDLTLLARNEWLEGRSSDRVREWRERLGDPARDLGRSPRVLQELSMEVLARMPLDAYRNYPLWRSLKRGLLLRTVLFLFLIVLAVLRWRRWNTGRWMGVVLLALAVSPLGDLHVLREGLGHFLSDFLRDRDISFQAFIDEIGQKDRIADPWGGLSTWRPSGIRRFLVAWWLVFSVPAQLMFLIAGGGRLFATGPGGPSAPARSKGGKSESDH
ncbi:MAG TPA: hypothetical protein ENK43_00125 [Planctomycetes bacterium]|nr:hypothetical protein [Planctomycetota bacterium]